MRFGALLCFLIACGDNHATPDGPISPDGPPPDQAPQPVTAKVLDQGAGVPDVPVYFLDANSQVVLATVTGPDGTASTLMDAGGSVTIVVPGLVNSVLGAPSGFTAHTVLGVEPGDTISIANGGSPLHVAHVEVTIPSDGIGGATSHKLFSARGGTTTEASSLATPGGTTAIDVLGTDGVPVDFLVCGFANVVQPTSWLFASGIAVTDNATITLPGAFAASVDRTVTVTNVDPATTQVNTEELIVNTNGLVIGLENTSGAPTGGSYTSPEVAGPPAVAGLQTHLSLSFRFDTQLVGESEQAVFTTVPLPAGNISFDTGNLFLHHVTEPLSYDVASHRISWGIAATGQTGDAAHAVLQVNRPDPSPVTFQWDVVAPASTDITLPTLPADVFDFTVRATDQIDVLVGEVAKGASYHDFRNEPSARLDRVAQAAPVGVLQFLPGIGGF